MDKFGISTHEYYKGEVYDTEQDIILTRQDCCELLNYLNNKVKNLKKTNRLLMNSLKVNNIKINNIHEENNEFKSSLVKIIEKE